jgi:hypothetical protein
VLDHPRVCLIISSRNLTEQLGTRVDARGLRCTRLSLANATLPPSTKSWALLDSAGHSPTVLGVEPDSFWKSARRRSAND